VCACIATCLIRNSSILVEKLQVIVSSCSVCNSRATIPSVSSRLVRTPSGRAVAVVITTPLPELEVGYRFRVLGTEICSSGFTFTGEPTGRPPFAEHSANALCKNAAFLAF
jgi:hypothetical protein